MGSCIRVCPVDAISYRENGLVWVDKDICISCERCIKVCPTGVMQWIPYDADYMVICNSKDKGAAVRKYCEVGCIACKLCEKKSPEGGYKVEDNLSRIDYSAEGEREEGMKACPTNCIIELK
jgi:Fe-S-cluster-containing hydrogenase component 2